MLATFQFAVTSARLTEERTILDQSGKETTEERSSDAPIDKDSVEADQKDEKLMGKFSRRKEWCRRTCCASLTFWFLRCQ